jgi:hypothetical protein
LLPADSDDAPEVEQHLNFSPSLISASSILILPVLAETRHCNARIEAPFARVLPLAVLGANVSANAIRAFLLLAPVDAEGCAAALVAFVLFTVMQHASRRLLPRSFRRTLGFRGLTLG